MADEENVRKEVWEGKIPICFTLADEEVGYSMSGERANPEPTYVSLSEYTLPQGRSSHNDDVVLEMLQFYLRLTLIVCADDAA